MAEAAGLVIGAVALASLFSTCVDAVDCIHHGRNYHTEHRHACAKLAALTCRLSIWGQTLNVLSPGREDHRLRRHWAEVQDVVTQNLSAIKDILESAQRLAERYKDPCQPQSFAEAFRPSHWKHSKALSTRSSCSGVTTTRRLSLVKRATWAIQDRQRFDTYLDKLASFIDNLEQVLKQVNMSDLPTANEGRRVSDTAHSSADNAAGRRELTGTNNDESGGGGDSSGGSNNNSNSSSTQPPLSRFGFGTVEGSRFLQGTATDGQPSAGAEQARDTFTFERVSNGRFHQASHDEQTRERFWRD